MFDTIVRRLREVLAQRHYLPQAFALVWTAARPWTMAWAVLLIIQGLLPTATVLLAKAVVDQLAVVLSAAATGTALPRTLSLVGLMVLVLLLTEALSSVATWVRTVQSERVRDHVHDQIHAQALRLDMRFFESPQYFDQLHRARVDAISRPVALLENMGRLVQNSITLTAMAAILIAYAWWLPLVLLFSTLPALWVMARYTLRFHRWRLRNTANERRTRYLDWMLTGHKSAAEIRLFDLGGHFRNIFQQLRRKLRRGRIALSRRQMLAEVAAGTLGLLVMGATMAWLIRSSFRGQASLGDIALFYQIFNQGQRIMRTLLTGIGEIYRNVLFLENLFQFLTLTPDVTDPAIPGPDSVSLRNSIRLEKVTFRYPGSRLTALENFDLTIPAGRIVAVVGENGAGKSTLIKLLCRFYDPTAGRIRLDGIDLREISPADLRRNITVLFQEPVKFHDTVANNIAFGDLAANPGIDEIESAAQTAGAEGPINRLPHGYETVLGKMFGGNELSVGEWQRVALARAFVRRAQLIILDEPTSAMDSWAEADWLKRFRRLVAGRTALIITHRFTTALQADIVHVTAVRLTCK